MIAIMLTSPCNFSKSCNNWL